MSSSFEFGEIDPTTAHAKHVQYLTLLDLDAGNHPDPIKEANPNNDGLIERQASKLKNNPENYRGAYDLMGDLVGYIKVDNWYYGLQEPFEHGLEKKLLFARKFITRSNTLPGNPLGIMGLVADPRLEAFYGEQAVTNMLGNLVDYAVEVAEEGHTPRAIYAPHHIADKAIDATRSRQFFFTGKSGELFDMQQNLYVRPAGTAILNRRIEIDKLR
ncbi:MAG: hypothetical protein JWO99_565 [Candidatus Saccharibacteria bacterium]|nr:hypothetical protein [Candidatus Saccharibacteria bacterium]